MKLSSLINIYEIMKCMNIWILLALIVRSTSTEQVKFRFRLVFGAILLHVATQYPISKIAQPAKIADMF